MKILVSWSSGKDSAWMLHQLRSEHADAVAALLTTTNAAFERVAMHGVRHEVLLAQAAAIGLPLQIVPLPWPCSNDDYERLMAAAMANAVRDGFTHVAFGDLCLHDVRRYREEQLAGSGLAPLFPLWQGSDTRPLADTMIAAGLKATLVTIDPRVLDVSFAGRPFDRTLLNALPPEVDPCGERGEFHTCVWDGPMFSRPLDLVAGAVVLRDGFAFADVRLREPEPPPPHV